MVLGLPLGDTLDAAPRYRCNLTQLAIEARRLSKIYRSIGALVECDIAIQKGKVFGLLGPNGAGKTTLLRTLLGFLRPTSGSASLMGFDCATQSVQVRQQVAYLPGEARLYRAMRGRDALELFSGLQHHGSLNNSLAIAKRLELDLSRRVMFMSTGMRQKLAISIVLGSDAPVIILDEPTANLDPTVRSEVVALVREIHNRERTILLSSHIFSDIEGTCDEVAILKRGRVVGTADLHQLRQIHIVRGRFTSPALSDSTDFQSESFVEFSRINGRQLELQLSGPPTHWLGWLSAIGLEDMTIDNAGVRALYERFHAPSQVQSAAAMIGSLA
jgi:ABC-2 type transport system ATP-binding protein